MLVTGAPGCYAELVAAAEESIWPIPDSLDASVAAAIGVSYRTAWWATVEIAGLERGDTLLVQAGSSATGQACIDIGRALGARVYATASGPKLDRLRDLGAEADAFSRSAEALAPDGRLVTSAVGDPQVSFNLWTLLGKRGRIIGIGSALQSGRLSSD